MIGLIMLLPTLLFAFRTFVFTMLSGLLHNIFRVEDPYYTSAIEAYAIFFYHVSWIHKVIIFCITLSFAFMVFSREKVEDEYIWKIRMDSLVLALIIDCILICVAIFTIFGMHFVTFMLFNFYIIVVLYLVIFRISISSGVSLSAMSGMYSDRPFLSLAPFVICPRPNCVRSFPWAQTQR